VPGEQLSGWKMTQNGNQETAQPPGVASKTGSRLSLCVTHHDEKSLFDIRFIVSLLHYFDISSSSTVQVLSLHLAIISSGALRISFQISFFLLLEWRGMIPSWGLPDTAGTGRRGPTTLFL
jgi:hypothetical protein